MRRVTRIIYRLLTVYLFVMIGVLGFSVFRFVQQEVQTSKYQARYLSDISKQLSYKLESGSTEAVRYPENGPYDLRLGYSILPDAITRLKRQGFAISAQAAMSPMMMQLADEYGFFTIYHEKSQAGLTINDKTDQVIFKTMYPAFNYANFEAIPPVIDPNRYEI